VIEQFDVLVGGLLSVAEGRPIPAVRGCGELNGQLSSVRVTSKDRRGIATAVIFDNCRGQSASEVRVHTFVAM
jgi:hypothetical protein